MDVGIKNCNNIDEGAVSIVEGRLNIKYAINGTGKSTISKAILCSINDQKNNSSTISELKPFKYLGESGNEPKVEGLEAINSLMVFDDSYINDFVFLPDELLKGSFDIFIRDDEYEAGITEINELVKGLETMFSENQDIDELIQDFNELSDGFGRPTKKGIHASSKISKAFKGGNKVENVPEGLEEYASFIKHDSNYKWVKWQIDGKPYLDISESCPYCTSDIKSKKEKITRVSEEYDHKSIESLNKLVSVFDRLSSYFSENTRTLINGFIKNVDGYTDEQETFLKEVREQIDNLRDKFLSVKNLGFSSLKDVDKVIEGLNSHTIDLQLYVHLNSENTKNKCELVNNSLSSLLEKAGELQGRINRQKILVERLVKENSEEINGFLTNAGYRYHVELVENDKGQHQLKLIHNDITSEVGNAKSHLSYGEKNAFSLVLFMYDAMKKSPDLIVLDAPISSFDKNKKYAIVDALFRKSKSLRNKTVLLLTHDFEPIVDMVYHHSDRFERPSASFLENVNGILSEKTIERSDIKTFIEINESNINDGESPINKLVYLRRLYEVTNNKGCGYQVVSNVFHKRSTPTFQDENSSREMSDVELQQGCEEIRGHIEDFDYGELISLVNNDTDIMSLYHSSGNNYEKLHIYRVIFDDKEDVKNADVVQKFINEAFHIENDYIYQLNPRSYQLVPQYVIDECDKVIGQG